MKHGYLGPASGAATMLIAIALWQAGCRGAPEHEETPLLAEARAGESNFSPYAPKNPYKETAPNLLTRTVFETAGPKGVNLEVRDLFVPPGKSAERITLPGPAVLEVLSGEGKLSSADKSQDLHFGVIVSIPQGASFSLESKDRDLAPLVIRARVFAP